MKPLQANVLAGALGLGLLVAGGQVHAAATIINPAGTVALGVNDHGHLNTATGNVALNSSRTGLAYNFPGDGFRDATSPGCFCEGWGVSVNNTTSGYANVDSDGGVNNLSLTSFGSTATTATSVVSLTSLPGLSVTHAYAPADNAPDVLFKSVVTIANNTGSAVSDLKYVRVMDWDVPVTEFAEFVTIKGTATTTLLEKSHNNGFNTANPLSDLGEIFPGGTTDLDVEDVGSADHGAYFRFNFGDLADGESYSFTIFYGAAGNEALALAAIGAEGIELYSLGQSSQVDPLTGDYLDVVNNDAPTFIFGFKGVGGTPLECGQPGQPPCPSGVPEPTAMALLGLGLAGAGAFRRRRRHA